jgi:two-component system chemotaxis response regulator CheB
MKPISVLVVDDSAVVRQVLTQALSAAPGIGAVQAVADPLLAMERMKLHWPDVIVLDVEMPRMDGITFLKKLMAERPTPVVICSSLTERNGPITMEALAAGAVAVRMKPRFGLRDHLQDNADDFISAVREAGQVNARRLVRQPAPAVTPKFGADAVLAAAPVAPNASATGSVIAIGASTGGTQALEVLLTAMPANAPGIVIVQHMPEKFTAAFAQRLDSLCRIRIAEAQGNEAVTPGVAYIAPGGRHLLLRRSGARLYTEVVDGPPVNRHRPSVDVLFRSIANTAAANAVGVIMTGMGNDGAGGLLEMRKAGAATLAQDEASCVVFGMPKEAIRRGGVQRTVSLDRLASEIIRGQSDRR